MTEQTTYDDVVYPSYAIYHMHPDALATLGHLHGLDMRPIQSCRVLELGSATGGNLFAMAEQLPNSQFLGIDLSGVQIDRGNAIRVELGLTNVELRQQSILDFGDGEERFDYILCHGVYSWSPPAVQARILEICQQHLAPNGVASISYNCLPGWSLPTALRRVLIKELPPDPTPEQCKEVFFDFLKRLDRALEDTEGARALLMRGEIELAKKGDWPYLFHEFFEDVNESLLVREFVERTAGNQLMYLGDLLRIQRDRSHWSDSKTDPPESYAELIRREQFEDFVDHRRFRSTALVHASAAVQRLVPPERIYDLFLQCNPQDLTMELEIDKPTRMTRKGGNELSISKTAEDAIGILMNRWPAAVGFGELWTHAQQNQTAERGDRADEEARRSFAAELLELYMGDVVDLHLYSPSLAEAISERPRVRTLNLIEAAHTASVSSGWHYRVKLNTIEHIAIRLTDGSRTHLELEAALSAAIDEEWRDRPSETKPKDIAKVVKICLKQFLRTGLLVD